MTPNVPFERVIRVASGICAGAAGVIAFLVLLTWTTDQWMLGTLGQGYVPMAPGTAAVILLLSLSVLASIHVPDSTLGTALCWFSILCTAGICIFVLATPLMRANLLFAAWLAPTRATAADYSIGAMSPMSMLVVLLSAAALALEIPPLRRSRANRQIASALALIGGLISSWVVFGYTVDAPVLYGTRAVPMALSGGIALALLSVGLVYKSGPGSWPMSGILADDSGEPSKWTAKGPITAFLLLFSAIAAVGGFYLEMQRANMRKAAQAELTAVADLKTDEIAQWHRERLADAHFFANAAFVSRDIQDLLSGADTEKATAEVLNWLALLKGTDHYSCVSIFDSGGNLLLSIPPRNGPPDGSAQALAIDTVRKNAVSITDLHVGEASETHLDLMVPVHAPGADPAVAAPIAVMGLVVDSAQFLFPYLQSWPTASPTAETLIARREGNDVLFLNELRHRKGTAMSLRLPLDRPGLPTAMAVQGKNGLVEGTDYRGVPVVAVLRRVQDSPWFLEAKVDQSEIYAASRRQVLHVALVMSLLILAAGLGIVALWRQRNLEYFRATLEQTNRQRVLAQRFEHLMRQASDIILLADEDGRIVEANDRAVQAYGIPLAELREVGFAALHSPEARISLERQTEELAQNGSTRFETEHLRADGSAFPVEVSARRVDIGGAAHQLFIMRDITERREREKEIERLNRLYAALSHVNQAIVRSRSRSEMLDNVCAALVEHGGLQLSWIGMHNPQNQSVTPVTGRCPNGAAFSKAEFFTDRRMDGQGPTVGTAVREDRSVICHDLAAAPCSPEVRREIERTGICASAALPVHLGGRIWGVLAVGARDAGYFGDREMALLEEAAQDVSFALDHLEGEAERQRAEDELRETQQRLSLAVEGARLGLWDWDLRTNTVHLSREYKRQLGYDGREFSGAIRRWEENLHPDDREWTLAAVADFVRNRGEYREMEFRLMHRDGSYRWILSRAVLQCDPDGEPTRMIGCHIDITDRKHSEEALRRSQENLVLAERIAHVGYWERPIDRAAIQWSDEAYRVFGLAPQERPVDLPAFLLMVHPEDRHAVSESIRATQEEDKPYNIDYRIVRADGTIRFVHAQGELFLDALGRPDRMFGTMLDITERKQTERALRENEQRFRVIAENTGDVIWQLDLATQRFTYVSPSVMRLRGYTPEEVMAQPLEEALTPDSFRKVAEGIAAYIEAQQAGDEIRQLHTSIVEQPCKDGSLAITEVVTTALTDAQGNVTGVLGVTRDISERVRTENALRKSEQRFRAAFEDGLFGMALVSQNGLFLNVNPALCHMLGYSEEELRERTFADITHPDERAESIAAVNRLLSGEADTFELEKRYLNKQGRVVWGMVRTRVLRNPDGTPSLLLAQVLDTTQRKEAERELLANQNRLKRAQAVGHIGSWEYELGTRTIWASEEACRILGLPPAEGVLVAETVESRIPGWEQAHRDILDQLKEHNAYDVEFALVPIDGGPQKSLRVVAELIRDDRDQPVRIVGVAEDITEHKRAAEELRETQERLNLTLESSGVGTFDWHISEGRHVWDDNTRRLFGMGPGNDDGMAEQFMAAVHPEDRDRISAEMIHTVRHQSEVEVEFRTIWQDGGVHDISVRGRVHRDASGRAVRMTGVCWDITARKEAESILRAYSDRLGRVIEEKTRQLHDAQDELIRRGKLAVLGQLAGGVGHELRNPLGVISNAVYFLKLINDGTDETSREYLNIISTEVRNSQKIISDLLGFARTGQADRSSVALSVLVAEVLEHVSPSRDVEVSVNIPGDLPLLSVDPGQIRQVLSNLMLNACQAMQGGGTLTVGAHCEGNRVRVSISDTGCGMSEEELSRIFEPLYSTKARGIGLGLSVTKNLLEANEGSIEVESKPGRGSTFTLALPAQE